VSDAIENGVGQSGISHEFVPAVDRKLAGDDQRASVVAVLDDLQQIALLLGQQWFGSPVVEYEKVDAAELTHQFGVTTVTTPHKSGDPVEQEKQLKYASLVANAIMLSNVADMTEALAAMAEDGHPVTPGLVACLSPYMREHIRRFGQYVLDMDVLPLPLNPQPLPFELAL
jgi:hypothetical protein